MGISVLSKKWLNGKIQTRRVRNTQRRESKKSLITSLI
jgi:hypothetical protein